MTFYARLFIALCIINPTLCFGCLTEVKQELNVDTLTDWLQLSTSETVEDGVTFTISSDSAYCYTTLPCIHVTGIGVQGISDIYIERTLDVSMWQDITIHIDATTSSMDNTNERGFIETQCDTNPAVNNQMNPGATPTTPYTGCFHIDVSTCNDLTIRIGGSLSGKADDIYITYLAIDYTPHPTLQPTIHPVTGPLLPSLHPTLQPTHTPTPNPTKNPTNKPSSNPTINPTITSSNPSENPSSNPTDNPSFSPSFVPSSSPTQPPSLYPTNDPTRSPTTAGATQQPSKAPLPTPTLSPTSNPSFSPSFIPSSSPTQPPSLSPTRSSSVPTADPSKSPSKHPVIQPTTAPTKTPPSEYPTATPTSNPIKADAVVTNYEISFEITSCEDQETECQLDEEIIEEVTEVIKATIGAETEDGIVDVISVEIVDDDLVIRLSVMTDPTQALKPGYITSHIEKEVEGNDNLDQLGEVEVEEKDPEFNDIVRKNAHPSVMQYIHTLISNPLYLGAALLALLICCCVICIFVIYNNIRKQRTKQIQLVNMSSMSTDDALGTPGMHAPLSGTGTAGTPGDALDGRIAGMDTTITTGLGQSPYVQNSAFMPLDAMSLSAGAMPLDTRMAAMSLSAGAMPLDTRIAAMSLSAGAMSMSPMGGVTATGHTNTDTIDRFGELADLPFETKDVTLGTEDVLMNGGDMDPDTDTDGEDEDMYVNDDKRASYMMTPGGTPGGDLLGGIECEEEEKQTTARVDEFMNDPQLQMEGGFGTLGPPPPPPLHSGEDANNTGYVMSDDAHATKGGLTD
eukprot:1160997_1